MDRTLGVRAPSLVIARIDSNSEEEEEMVLNKRKTLKELLEDRAKGQTSKDPVTPSPLPTLPPHPPPPLGSLLPIPNLRKKRKEEDEIEEGEMALQKEPKQQKMANGQTRASSVDSREEREVAEVCHQNSPWAPQLEIEGATIPRNSTIREFQKEHAHYLAKALD